MQIALPVARRGRPRNLERRRTIAREAMRLLAERGFAGCTMREVAAASGIGENLLYRYFASKDILLAAVVDSVVDRFTATIRALREPAARATSLRELLLAFGTVYTAHVDELSGWYAAWFGGLPLTTQQREQLRLAEDAIVMLLTACVRRRGVVGDPYVFARSFVGALQSLILMQNRARIESASPSLRSLFLEELVATFLAAATPRSAA
ncbi:MAG: TetR family transcriptional regulator [Candidatus Eremiobacteraeota bacterium]|nr:TetR family transcriptional regulator [Candidatus Eremiobacteraeota bacterium]